MLEITTKDAEPLKLVKAPFANERELEDYLFAHPGELGLKAFIARQYRLPGGGVADLIGVDGAGLDDIGGFGGRRALDRAGAEDQYYDERAMNQQRSEERQSVMPKKGEHRQAIPPADR